MYSVYHVQLIFTLTWPRWSELCLKESHCNCQEVILLLCVHPVPSSGDLNKKGIWKQLPDSPDIRITFPGRPLLPAARKSSCFSVCTQCPAPGILTKKEFGNNCLIVLTSVSHSQEGFFSPVINMVGPL